MKLGTEKASPELRSFVTLTNLNGIIYFVMDLILAVAFYFIIGDMHVSTAHICSAIIFLICSLGFNYKGWINVSRMSTVLIGSVLITYTAFYLGIKTLAPATLLLGAIFPFVYFSLNEKKMLFLSMSFPIFGYALLIGTDYSFGPQVGELGARSILLLRIIFFIFPLVGIAGNCFSAVSEINKKNQTLAESKKVIETIFYALSHDLASPMQTVSILSQFGNDHGALTQEKLKRMHASSEQMVRIFKNLQAVAQTSSAGKISLNLEKCSIKELITEALIFSNEQAKNKNLELVITPLETVDAVHILVDREIFIFQIITNFITNAIKFSDPGQKINLIVELADSDHVRIKIKDSGVGIPADKMSKLFSWSDRTSTAGTQGEKGTGLGLPLAKKFLDEMKGTICVKSHYKYEGHGTEIIMTFPLVKSVHSIIAA